MALVLTHGFIYETRVCWAYSLLVNLMVTLVYAAHDIVYVQFRGCVIMYRDL